MVLGPNVLRRATGVLKARGSDWHGSYMLVLKADFKGRITPRHDSILTFNWNKTCQWSDLTHAVAGVTATWEASSGNEF